MRVFKGVLFKIKNILFYPLNKIKKNKISIKARISSNAKISNSKIGKYCYIANNVTINYSNIGNYCSIAPNVQIGGMEHSHWWLSTSTFLSNHCIYNKKTIVEDDVWIAAGSIIKQGVKIGRGSVVGAMSFVNKDVPPNSIVFGIPAKVIRKRMKQELFNELVKSNYYNYNSKKAKSVLSKIENTI